MYIYESLADEIAMSITRGQLKPGMRLPSVRKLANMRSVSINTVKAAYCLLEDRGLINPRPQSGYFVSNKLPLLKGSQQPPVHENVPLSGINRLLAVILNYQRKEGYVDLALACPSGAAFYPTYRLRKLTAQVLRAGNHTQDVYVMPPGSARLRSQIARRGLQQGMVLSAQDILITHGTMEALNLAVRASTQPGDTVALETPTFYNLYPMIEDLGRKVISVPTDPHSGICLDTLEALAAAKDISAVITIPTGQNPLGFSMPESHRRRLAAIANRYKIAVIEDAMYAELQFGANPVPNVKAFDEDGWVLCCASFTKTAAPDFRLGWLEAGRFRDVAAQMKFSTTVAEPGLLCEVLGLFLENGSYDHHLRHLRQLYNRQIDIVRACIAASFPEGTRVSRPDAGFILWIELPESIDTLPIFHAALDEKIICMPGVLCAGNKAFANCLRLAVCFDISEKHKDAIRTLGTLAQRQASQKS